MTLSSNRRRAYATANGFYFGDRVCKEPSGAWKTGERP
jgi:hypothetical protein